jgi:uncharacterized membrane protein YccC
VADLATRLIAELGNEFQGLLVAPRTRAALRTAIASVASMLVAQWLELDDPWWAAITGFVLIQRDAGATFLRSIDRAAGTIVGAVIGYLTAGTIQDHLTFQVLVASCAAFSIYGQERAEHGYAVLLVGVTVILILFGSLAEPGQALNLSVYRTLEILVGIAVTCFVDYGLAAPAAPGPAAAAKPGIWSLPVDRDLLVAAITGGIAIALIPLVWESLERPGLAQTPITAFIILTSLRQEPFWKALTRLSGCILGGAYGLVMMHFIGDSFLPWLTALFIGIFVCGHIFRGGGDIAYVGMQAGFPMIMAMVQGSAATENILPAVDRVVGVVGGVLVVSVCHPLVTPLVRWAIDLVAPER